MEEKVIKEPKVTLEKPAKKDGECVGYIKIHKDGSMKFQKPKAVFKSIQDMRDKANGVGDYEDDEEEKEDEMA